MTTDTLPAMPKPTVLIVDDIPANLGVAVEHLESRGYRVVVAQEGEEGLRRAVFVQPDIILLDVMLPGQNGFEICRHLKADDKTRDIPVIFMTSLIAEEDKLTGFQAGGVDYITKPLHIGELQARIETHLKLSRMQKQLELQNRLLQQHQQNLERLVEERTAELSASNRSLASEIGVRQSAEAALQESERQYRSLVENTPDTIARYDRDCRRLYANPKLIEALGGDIQRILNRTPTEFPGGSAMPGYEALIRQVFADGQPVDYELVWRDADNKRLVSHIRLTPEFCADGTVTSVLTVGRDITEIDQYRRSVHRLAFYDALTDLPNRALLVDRLRQTITDAAWHGYRFALMLLDLDHFKNINDVLGHDMGDLLLGAAAERLQGNTRDCDMVARLGGDEFALLLPLQDEDDITAIADNIVRLFEQPFLVADRELFISTSIGIAQYPKDHINIDALFRYADSAMYHAKKLGRNNYQFYMMEMTAQSAERMALEAALRYARANNELELYYQPQVDLASGRITGAEALLRWNRGAEGTVTPDKFIPIAEESGLIVGIGEWVIYTACEAAANLNAGRAAPFKVAINLSTRQFLQNDLLNSVQFILQETQCRPDWLKLEITESLLLDNSDDILDILNAFHAMGLAISIDDFGTGYSALSYLNRFPVSQIKIDRSFVRDIPGDNDKAELVKAMIFIAQALHLDLVAEGVETREQAHYLSEHGCLGAQGYLFGKPMTYAEFVALLATSEA